MARVSDGADTDTSSAPALRATGVELTYRSRLPFVSRETEVLRGVDLDLRPGEIVGIVGANGSGKSTLMKILVGALQPDAGSVSRDTTVGWCPQEQLLYDRLTVRETFDLFGEAYDLSDAYVERRRDDLAERLDFEAFLDYRVDQLSGGNRQKVNLAVALLHDPDVLLLDEPYTGFDWETYLAFWTLTESLVERGTAIVVVSHLISERERFDRVLELRDGRLHEQTTPRQPRSAAHDGTQTHDTAESPGGDATQPHGDDATQSQRDGTVRPHSDDATQSQRDGTVRPHSDDAAQSQTHNTGSSSDAGQRGDE